jgi:hypothetical protein
LGGAVTLTAEPLVAFADLLGIEPTRLAAVESVESIHHTFSIDGARAAALSPTQVRTLLAAYPGAIRAEFRLGDLVELTIDERVTDQDIEAFATRASSNVYDFVLEVRKPALLDQLLAGQPTTARVVLFVFAEALRSHLLQGLADFEERVWSEPERRLILGILDVEAVLLGDHLCVLGGDFLARLPDTAQTTNSSSDRLAAMAASRDRFIGWDAAWTRQLTPLHFWVEGTCRDPELLGLIRSQFVKLAVLFTCDRARERKREDGSKEIRAEYRGREHVAAVVIDEQEPLKRVGNEELSAVRHIVEWCYQREPMPPHREWVTDRLPFVQTRVAQALEGRPEEERFRAFITAMPYLAEGVEWHWKAFIEGRVTEYLDRVQQLEGLVSATLERLSDQVGGQVKHLSDTMLAAVAVLIGSFIAAAFEDPFNEPLFRIALLTYGGYVGIFPGLIGMFASSRSFFRVRDNFEAQRGRFAEALLPDRVDEIVGSRVSNATRGYWWWFSFVSLAYVLVVIAAVVAAMEVPSRIR